MSAGSLVPATDLIAQVGSSAPASKAGRTDVRKHLTPPILLQTVSPEQLGGFAKWTPEKALEEMEKAGVATGVTSIPPRYDPNTIDRIARQGTPAN